MTERHDVAILGAGSAGYATALRAAQLGLGVVMVDRGPVGGTCLHRGCIPTKAWLHAADVRRTVAAAPSFGISAQGGDVDAARVREYAEQVVGGLHKGLEGLLRSRNVEVVPGDGRLVVDELGPGIDLDGSILRARNIVVATGAEPVTLGLPVDGERIITSEHALRLQRLPRRAVVIGGGVIGVEFASMWNDLGVEVTLVEALPRLLPTEEPDLSEILARQLGRRGIDLRLGAAVEGARATDDGVEVTVGGEALSSDLVLVAVGRRPNVAPVAETELRLDGAHVAVDEFLATSQRGVFAVGDLVKGPQLAHRGYAHGMFVAERIAQLEGRFPGVPVLPKDRDIARITYSSPQVASVGMTTEQARSVGEVETADFHLRGNGRALILRAPGEREPGLVRIIRRKGGEIVGVHAIGDDVAELITEGALLVNWRATPEDVRDVVHPHPTLGEALAEANLQLAGAALHMHG
ncbi:dihydrolipoyl dehydrogenase [Tessaracoccus rhinocerotis]|uniref:Dihydrolipoyl dehydrogenase n=1 Tax=Tessaracoccus rhinocerotis TaxID=1689449 RepID=A0A553K2A7_9ACTN|nr:dihydrolipoyl dehydrogenase [Tessaracoccus rhinocerotis]TRY18825.1 dihydrolipoyl dehydrogenase [Tessaracoccus rhinocerotis]